MHFRNTETSRRHFLAAMSAGGLFFTTPGAFAQTLTLTPAQTEGPYYPNVMPLDRDNDLLVINDNITPAVGTVSWISGRILSRTGSPIRNAVIEIWAADNVGSYIHTSGALNGQRDSNYQGYGRFETASNGQYLFRAVKPGLYPGRVRHVHAKITIPGGQSLTTQLYVEGETGNDSVLNGIRDTAQRESVIRPWTAISGSPVGALAVNWDVIMDYTPAETAATTRPALISLAGGVTHGATLRAGAASGSWVALNGTSLATDTRTWRADEIVDGNLPTSLDGVSVQINNQPAFVQFISPTQVNVLAPEAVSDGTVQVTLTNANGTSAPVSVEFLRTSPGFFQYPDENIAAVRTDGAYIAPEGLISGVSSIPAQPGETIVLYGTGFGPTSPAAEPGKVVSSALRTASAVHVRIHNQDAAVSYSGLVSAGLYQINVTVPDLPDGDYPVTAEVGGVRTGKFVKLRVAKQTTAMAPSSSRRLPGLNILRHTVA